jgi:MoxR-like ATPase
MMEIRLAEAAHQLGDAGARERLVASLYSRDMLIERPLLSALTQERSPVLLIDELDRADEPFDAFLLEVLAENQLTIPELGTVKAAPGAAPIVVITSNRTREIHDALKRRCLYHWVDYPEAAREIEIVRIRAPGAAERLTAQIVAFVQRLRVLDLFKAPGIAETIDWTNALVALNTLNLAPENVRDTLGVLLKHRDDIAKLQGGELTRLLAEAQAVARGEGVAAAARADVR